MRTTSTQTCTYQIGDYTLSNTDKRLALSTLVQGTTTTLVYAVANPA